jgi:hypothetical protein
MTVGPLPMEFSNLSRFQISQFQNVDVSCLQDPRNANPNSSDFCHASQMDGWFRSNLRLCQMQSQTAHLCESQCLNLRFGWSHDTRPSLDPWLWSFRCFGTQKVLDPWSLDFWDADGSRFLPHVPIDGQFWFVSGFSLWIYRSLVHRTFDISNSDTSISRYLSGPSLGLRGFKSHANPVRSDGWRVSNWRSNDSQSPELKTMVATITFLLLYQIGRLAGFPLILDTGFCPFISSLRRFSGFESFGGLPWIPTF